MNRPELTGLYCITDTELAQQSPHGLEHMVEQAIKGGARIIQYRDKLSPPREQQQTAVQLCQICRQQDVIFLVNDDPELAKTVNAHGVHLGQSDTHLNEARALLGQDKIIGITCHADLSLALRAQNQGADYVAFGRFFPSETKPEASPAPIELLAEARQSLQIPVVAIGGITLENGASLLKQGADMLAVIHAVFGQKDIQQAAAQFTKLF